MSGAARLTLLALAGAVSLLAGCSAGERITVGSKAFPESYLLAEIFAQTLESAGIAVERRPGLGGTLICYQALRQGEVDVYPEYTGTIVEAILKTPPQPGRPALTRALAALGLQPLADLGFDNSYAIAVHADTAGARGLHKISDLAAHPDLRLAFSHEFIERSDGWRGLREAYALEFTATGLEHGLSYQAIAERRIDVTDAYATDGELQRYNLQILADDRQFFPHYRALPLAREDLLEAAVVALSALAGRIDDARMRTLNAEAVVRRRPIAAIAAEFLAQEGIPVNVPANADAASADGLVGGEARRDVGAAGAQIWRYTLRHLQLTVIALVLACVAGVTLGIAVHRSARTSRIVLYAAGLMQTIPSIALLALMIPIFGIGVLPAIVALFLYSLLPILRNTITALVTIDPLLRGVAEAMGLTRREQVRHVLFPLALPNVMAGIRTAAVISIGTATLAAFIGAGGLGQPIYYGLTLNDTGLILQGAIPAALLALATELGFEWLERRLVPRHMLSGNVG